MEKIMFRNIEAERVRAGLTQEELSKKLGISRKTYNNWITGETEIPASKLVFMKHLWNVTADYLLFTTDQEATDVE